MQDRNDRIVADLMEQLIETGPDGMAGVFTALFNLAMRVEREQHLGARAYERTPERGGYRITRYRLSEVRKRQVTWGMRGESPCDIRTRINLDKSRRHYRAEGALIAAYI